MFGSHQPAPTPGVLGTSSDPKRRFQHVRERCATQVQVGSKLNRHRVWYVAALVPIFWRKIPRIADHGEHLDLSAFLVVVWCTYRLGSSALIRTIAADTTVYFLTMVALQIDFQLNYSLMEVRSFARFTHLFAKYNHCRVSPNKCRSCEYAIDLNDSVLELTISTSRLKFIRNVCLLCAGSRVVILTSLIALIPY